MNFLNHIFNKHRDLAISILAILAFAVILKVFAATTYGPGDTLDPAEGPGDATVQIFPDQTGHSGEFLSTNGSDVSWDAVAGGSSQWQDSGSDIYFNTGNVGIGTATPNSLLSVSGNANSPVGLRAINLSTATQAYSGTYYGTSASETDVFFGAFGSGNTQYAGAARGALISWGNSAPLIFVSSGGEVFRQTQNVTRIGLADTSNFLQIQRYSSGSPYSFIVTSGSNTDYSVPSGLDFQVASGSGNINSLVLHANGNSSFSSGAPESQSSTAKVNIKGADALSTTYALKVQNSTPTDLFNVRNDGYISAGLANGSMTIGASAGFSSLVAKNTFIGVQAATSGPPTGEDNVGIGYQSMYYLGAGAENTSVGSRSGVGITGSGNVSLGYNTLTSAGGSSGNYNIALGHTALNGATTGSGNIAIGFQAGTPGISGSYNTITGFQTMGAGGAAGEYNAAYGWQAMYATTGNNNSAFGAGAGKNTTTGASNVFIGYKSGFNQTTASDILLIDNQDRGTPGAELTDSLIYGQFDADPVNQILTINGKLKITQGSPGAGKVLTSDAAGLATWQTASAPVTGVYTPTLTNNDNLDSSTAHVVSYTIFLGQDGYYYFTMAGSIEVDPTASDSTDLTISLPPDLPGGALMEESGGVAAAATIAGQVAALKYAFGELHMVWIAVDTTEQPMYFNFTGRYIPT